MKILLLNGSPRKGNIFTALDALKQGLSNIQGAEIFQINATDVNVSHCVACEYCKESGKCIVEDDTNSVINAVAEADILIFATPVYWWGISAQLKVIIDKFYSQQNRLLSLKKKVGLIVTGQLSVDNVQYAIISRQFESICNYLGWDLLFCNTYSAYLKDDIKNNRSALLELYYLCNKIVEN